ncbi:hypothetical protein FHS85_002781 [Rhodoligotrophos appendicifer]|uniref:DUF6494 family protein n=1 Tax=Rhodoligotrophos appendicifer TaxID=987056 RepID=UPI0011861862|nr:DUF6494 family protein [Rhodoligotrophos appendicifer]
MDEDRLNISIRQFLKEVGITSQRQVETAARGSSAKGRVAIRAVVTCDELGLHHVVDGELDLD